MSNQSVRGHAFDVSARDLSDAATIYKDTLAARGLAATCLDDLEAGVAKLEATMIRGERSSA
ncbi:MAG TPA: hypothetical protein VFD67_13775 [Gemmatimonadaceae bacterium]|jgi:hypothetical protein|nr:hypothetical protein [Gemmatimonadaceae bacterium]